VKDQGSGHVWIVGAGPGDPDLITIGGLDALRRADVVVHDRLVAPALLDRASPAATIIDAGKRPDAPMAIVVGEVVRLAPGIRRELSLMAGVAR
jgi:siroheme synthase